MKKDQRLPNKNNRIINAQENRSQIAIKRTDHKPHNLIILAEDHQIDKIHRTIHKIDIADQTAKIISVEIFTLDWILIEVITQTKNEMTQFQTLGIGTIQMTLKKFFKQPQLKIFK